MTDRLILIAALSEGTHVIGSDNGLPWNVPGDYQQFLDFVRGHAVFMGRTTYEIFGADLGESDVFVITRRAQIEGPGRVVGSVEEAIEAARATGRTVYCGGGASVYAQALSHATDMYLSLIHGNHEGDARFPEWDTREWRETERTVHPDFTFVHLERSRVRPSTGSGRTT